MKIVIPLWIIAFILAAAFFPAITAVIAVVLVVGLVLILFKVHSTIKEEENRPAVEAKSVQKKSKIPTIRIIFLLILIWAGVAYVMTSNTVEQQAQVATSVQAAKKATAPVVVPAKSPMGSPAAVEATETTAATVVVETEKILTQEEKNKKRAADALMDVFAPEGK